MTIIRLNTEFSDVTPPGFDHVVYCFYRDVIPTGFDTPTPKEWNICRLEKTEFKNSVRSDIGKKKWIN